MIEGGTGNDMLYGGTDTDTFAFQTGDGADTIYDFDTASDMIRLTGTGLTYANLTITQSGTTATVTYGTDTIALLNTDSADVTEGLFEFV